MYACQSAFTKAILSRVAWLILAIGLIHTAWGQAIPLPEPLVVDRPLTTLLAQERMVVYTGTITTPYAFLAALKAPSGEIKTGEAMSEPAYRCPEAWICIPLVNTTDELQKMVMNLDHNRCDTLEAWVGRKDSLSLRYVGKLDRGMPLEQRAIPLRDFALPFELAPHDSLLLLLRSRRTTGVHELNPVVSTEKAFMINHEKEEVIRLLALASVFFFMFTVFSLGVIFRHRLLICFGVYMFPIALGQLNYNYFFDAFPFPARLSLTANSIGLFIIFMANALFHSFGTEYIRSLGIYQTGHRYAIRTLVVANLIPMGLLLVPLRPPLQAFVTAASLLLTTLNILWLFYISVLGFIEKREKYLLITSTLIFVPVLYKTYLGNTPILNYSVVQPIYYLFLFGYLILALFRRELVSRQMTNQQIQSVHQALETLRKTEIEQIGRNLHDQLGNTLASALGYLNLREPNVTTAQELIREAIGETRVLSHNLVRDDLRPLDEKLEDLIERFNDFSAIAFVYNDFTEGQLGQLSTLKQEGIYRIIQEVLTNIVKHSQATEAVVQVFLNEKLVRITVEDDGIGYTLNEKTNGIGIRNMYKRAELAGLILTLDGGSGGTLVSLETAMKD